MRTGSRLAGTGRRADAGRSLARPTLRVRAMYLHLLLGGFSPAEAADLAAFRLGLRPAGWCPDELEQLLRLADLVRNGRLER